jgi:hypothetical protein
MKIIALEEHFILPKEESNLPPGAHRGNDREKLLGFDVIAELLDLGGLGLRPWMPPGSTSSTPHSRRTRSARLADSRRKYPYKLYFCENSHVRNGGRATFYSSRVVKIQPQE